MWDFSRWSNEELKAGYDQLLKDATLKGSVLTSGGAGESNFNFTSEVKLMTRLQILFRELRRRGLTVAPPPISRTRVVFGQSYPTGGQNCFQDGQV